MTVQSMRAPICDFTMRVLGVAGLVAVLAIPVMADTSSDSTTTTNGNMTTTTTTTTTTPSADRIDYSVLVNPPISYFDIVRAHAYGLTKHQIGEVAALAKWTGVEGSDILNRLEEGATLPDLAIQYGVSLDRLSGETKYTDWVGDYVRAYRHTGAMRMKHPDWNDDVTTSETTTTTDWYRY